MDNFHPYPVEQNGSDCRQAIQYVVYRLLAIATILFYWVKMKVVQQLTCLTLGRPGCPVYSTGELLNTPLVFVAGWQEWHAEGELINSDPPLQDCTLYVLPVATFPVNPGLHQHQSMLVVHSPVAWFGCSSTMERISCQLSQR